MALPQPSLGWGPAPRTGQLVGTQVQVPAAVALEPVHWILGVASPLGPPFCEQPQVRFEPSPFGKAVEATVLHLSPIFPFAEWVEQVALSTHFFCARSQCLFASEQVLGQAIAAPVHGFTTLVAQASAAQATVLTQQVPVLAPVTRAPPLEQTPGEVHLQAMSWPSPGSNAGFTEHGLPAAPLAP